MAGAEKQPKTLNISAWNRSHERFAHQVPRFLRGRMSKPDTPGVIAPPPLLALAAIVLGLLLDGLFPAYVLAVVLPHGEHRLIGAILIVAGLALAIPAVLAFRRAETHAEPWKPATALVTGGVFRFLRNPMYAGLLLFVAGLAFLTASDWMLVMTIVLAFVLHIGVVKSEERYLEGKFGAAYRRYSETVPRYGWPF
jgi:protein-S-isoprenylcysteine O-methyltransferase Ste14